MMVRFLHQCFLISVLTFLSPSGWSEERPELLSFNTGANNRDLAISPDGRYLLTTITSPKNQMAVIAISKKQGDGWGPLSLVSFSGEFPDIEPAFAPSGEFLYFASKRPKPGREGEDWDIWKVSFADGLFGDPVNVGAPINSEGNEFYPSIANSGAVYFTASRDEGMREDIYRARVLGGETLVERLGAGVNTETWEFNAFVSPDERYLIFGSQRREDEIGGGDLYISFADDEGIFQPARILSAGINTQALDYCPFVHDDRFYFSSERFENLEPFKEYESALNSFLSPGNGQGDVYSLPLDRVIPNL